MVEDMSSPQEAVKPKEEAKTEPIKAVGNVLTADELIAGSDVVHAVEIDTSMIRGTIKIKPVTLKTVQMATKASGGDTSEVSKYLIKQALVEPQMNDSQVDKLPIGLVSAISDKINEISGISKEMVANAKNS